ncbi:hypothetical protein C2G38_2166604 [Gigaspora rosea]|uniref:Uncharacterized protein n=1 Tax=Gigaspora rosea TaxID=44941 RepID=A0A397W1E5_9GLOM|nr:hypothetical protein C2G38_2166604 [Gigaspora rosea]
MSQIETRDKSRKRKDHEKDVSWCKDSQFRKSRNDRSKQSIAKLFENSGVPSFIIEIDQEFEATLEHHSS